MVRSSAALLVVAAVVGCHPSRSQPGGPVASGSAAPLAATPREAPARFSRPIAAAHTSAGGTFVAGLVVPRGTVALTALAADGATRWSRDVIPGVTWSANATLNVLGTKTGAIVVWRGLRGGQDVTLAAKVDADGKVDGEPFAVGAAACATEAELAWIERGPKGSWVVKTQPFGGVASLQALTLPEDRDPSVLCGQHRVFAFADGEDDVMLSTWGPGARATPLRIIADTDFRGDEERGHEVYAVGDVLGVVRMGSAGSVATREVGADRPSAWRRFGRKLTEKDDLTLVDADAHTALMAFSREAAAAGADAPGALSVEAFAWERDGAREASYTIAPPDGAVVRGPFWSGAVTGGVVVAWAERPARVDAGGAPIVALAYRVVSVDALGEPHRIDRPADELVDAGCDDTRCYAVALARAAGEDGGQPEVAQVLAYP
jgi:hypothetical protein